MKLYKSTTVSNNLKKLFIALLSVCPSFFLYQAKADGIVAFTNQDDLFFEIVMPKTNWVAGEKITASMVISNISSVTRMIPWQYGDPCTTGFGEYLIINGKTGKRLDCIVSLENRTTIGPNSLGLFEKDEFKRFESNLTRVYGLTNAGDYWIQATGRFQYVGSPEKYFTLVTPRITISLSPKAETNAPPK